MVTQRGYIHVQGWTEGNPPGLWNCCSHAHYVLVWQLSIRIHLQKSFGKFESIIKTERGPPQSVMQHPRIYQSGLKNPISGMCKTDI